PAPPPRCASVVSIVVTSAAALAAAPFKNPRRFTEPFLDFDMVNPPSSIRVGLLSLASKVGRIVRTSHAFILRHLRILAQRPRHVDAIARYVTTQHLIGRNAGFAPALERTHVIHLIRTGAASAVSHAGNHEETHPVVLLRTHFGKNAVVVIDSVAW